MRMKVCNGLLFKFVSLSSANHPTATHSALRLLAASTRQKRKKNSNHPSSHAAAAALINQLHPLRLAASRALDVDAALKRIESR